jgi:hypothetical protein
MALLQQLLLVLLLHITLSGRQLLQATPAPPAGNTHTHPPIPPTKRLTAH